MGQLNVFDSETSHYVYEYTLRSMWESRPLSGDDVYTWIMVTVQINPETTFQVKAARFFSGKQSNLYSQIIYKF